MLSNMSLYNLSKKFRNIELLIVVSCSTQRTVKIKFTQEMEKSTRHRRWAYFHAISISFHIHDAQQSKTHNTFN